MMRLMSFCCALLISMTLTLEHADAAKRFGGGGSFGKMFSTPKKVAPAPKPAPSAAPTNQSSTTAAKPKSGMGGMLGGLLAGGVLAALFFGGAFDGIQFMDILIIALIAFVAYRFLSRMKQPQRKPQYAHGSQPQQDAPSSEDVAQTQPQAFEPTPLMSQGLASAEVQLPEWFNKDAFLEGARQHFATLQQAWNRNDLEEIRSYCDADLYDTLVVERAKLGEEVLDNEVVSVMSELIGFEERDNRVELSINFYGWMREGTDAQTTEFNEIWHLTKATDQADADWFIVGIEQP